ncbi:MAG TPA: 4-hydroxybenzoate decarboxylase, partial [Chloroflexota bacterium]|nr:4-hydroxybenzoate decarboxylase [Chloroflexota bacterium]
LDYTGTALNRGSKGVLMGLGDSVRDLPQEFRLPEGTSLPEGIDAVQVFCPGCLVLQGRPYAEDREQAARVAAHPAFAGWPMLVLADEASIASSPEQFLWATFTRFEPGGDIHPAGREIHRHHLAYSAPILFDARMKPHYPTDVRPARETVDLVDRRWQEYFPAGMPHDPRPSGEPV